MDIDKLVEEDWSEDTPAQLKARAEAAGEFMHYRRARKAVRYRLYRLRTEAEGGPSANEDEQFQSRFEGQEHFGGWRNFSVTWDVSADDPFVCVHRDKAQSEEWEALVRAKFPVLNLDGTVTYPDPRVKKAVAAEAKRQKRAKKKGR